MFATHFPEGRVIKVLSFILICPYIVCAIFRSKVKVPAKNNQSTPNCILFDLETLVYNFHEDGWYEHYLVNVKLFSSFRYHYILTFTIYGLCDLIYKQIIIIIVGVQMNTTTVNLPFLFS